MAIEELLNVNACFAPVGCRTQNFAEVSVEGGRNESCIPQISANTLGGSDFGRLVFCRNRLAH